MRQWLRRIAGRSRVFLQPQQATAEGLLKLSELGASLRQCSLQLDVQLIQPRQPLAYLRSRQRVVTGRLNNRRVPAIGRRDAQLGRCFKTLEATDARREENRLFQRIIGGIDRSVSRD